MKRKGWRRKTEPVGVDWEQVRKHRKAMTKQADKQLTDDIYRVVIQACEAVTGVKGIPS